MTDRMYCTHSDSFIPDYFQWSNDATHGNGGNGAIWQCDAMCTQVFYYIVYIYYIYIYIILLYYIINYIYK